MSCKKEKRKRGMYIDNDLAKKIAVFNPVKENYATPEYFRNLFDAIDNEDICKKFLYELETRIITHD